MTAAVCWTQAGHTAGPEEDRNGTQDFIFDTLSLNRNPAVLKNKPRVEASVVSSAADVLNHGSNNLPTIFKHEEMV